MLLSQLPTGARALVDRLEAASPVIDDGTLLRLAELGFLPGEPVQIVQRGPGGREPLAVLVGDTLFALRLVEAGCVAVTPAAA
ncbi:FeoA family protein [Ideonella dechloratans]|uniref:FeoA family protein n=1 Tax=Ideonella dechloratans TaxID=36863 RepID=UPI0035B1AB9F